LSKGCESIMPLELLKKGSAPEIIFDIEDLLEEDDAFGRIRCPLCAWRPDASSRWACVGFDGPESGFLGCGTVWNTFATRGRCPGCAHQWRWTSCLMCGEWSPHVEWYEESPR
jgi:hypothetical protein